jgi:uncharacterized membrane protein
MQEGAAKCGACGAAAGAPAVAANTSASSGGMADNMAGALAYIFIVGVIFLVVEPFNKKRFVRFHAFQSIFFHVALVVLWIAWWFVLMIIGLMSHILAGLLSLLSLLLGLGIFVCWIFLIVQAYSNKEFKLPFIGDMAAKQAGS